MGLTTRDLTVIRYLEKNFLLDADILSRLVYWTGNEHYSLNASRRRLKAMTDLKQVKRMRQYVSQSYVYYLGKLPSKVEHRLAMSDFLSQMAVNGFEILLEETEVEFKALEKMYHVRPDMLVTFKYHDKVYQALVEIDLTKQFTNADKYKKVIEAKRGGELKGILDYPLAVVSVCNKRPEDLKCVWIKPDWSNFSNFTYSFIK